MDVKSNIATIGHNMPPPTPFELSKQAITDLVDETTLWCDGKPITTPGQAEGIQTLIRKIQAAAKEADERRKAEAKVFDDGKAGVQARYNPLIQKDRGAADKAISALKATLTPWLRKLEDEQREAAAKARAEAEEKERIAREAMRAADATNLAERNAAEALIEDAKRAEADARRAEKAKPIVKGFAGRASGLLTTYRAEVTDYPMFARHIWQKCLPDFKEWMDGFAQVLIKHNRDIPGVTVHEERHT